MDWGRDMFSHRVVLLLSASAFLPCIVSGQSVVSVRSGVLHFFEGSVTVDGQPLEQRFGRFYELKPGSELRTDNGRAEVLLTPGVFLRVDGNSSIRMLSNRLTDTRVEFIGGAAALDSRGVSGDDPITITYRNYEVHVKRAGNYKFNSGPAELRVKDGAAEVTLQAKIVRVNAGQMLPFSGALSARQFDSSSEDSLDRWAQERNDAIAAGNTLAAASDNLSGALDQAPADPYGAGGGYSYGQYFPGDPPSDRTMLWNGYASPFYMSPYYYPLYLGGTLPRYNYIRPPSRFGVGNSAYRQPSAFRNHPYVPPIYHAPSRITPSVGYRPAPSPGVMTHGGAARAGGHR